MRPTRSAAPSPSEATAGSAPVCQRQPRPPGERLELGGERTGAQAHGDGVGGGQRGLGVGACAALGQQRLRQAPPRVGRGIGHAEGVPALGQVAPRRGRAAAAGARPLGLGHSRVEHRLGRAVPGREGLRAHDVARALHERVGERPGGALGLRVAGRPRGDRQVRSGPRAHRVDRGQVEGVLVRRIDAGEHGLDLVTRRDRVPAPQRQLGGHDGRGPRPHRPERVLLRALRLLHGVGDVVEAAAQDVEQPARGQRSGGMYPAHGHVEGSRDGEIGVVPAPQPQQAHRCVAGQQGGDRADALLDRDRLAVAGELRRLGDAPGPVERLAEVDVGARHLLGVAALLGDAQCLLAVLDPVVERARGARGRAHGGEDAALLAAGAGGARDGERRLADRERLDPASQQHEQVTLRGEDAGAARRVALVRQQRHGGAAALEALERVAADPQVAPEALGDQRGRHRVRGRRRRASARGASGPRPGRPRPRGGRPRRRCG